MTFSKSTKLQAWMRDLGRCKKCDCKIPSMSEAQFDHIHPANLGGPDTVENCNTLCIPCHKVKTFGTKATTAGSDVQVAAKVKRLAKGGKTKSKTKIKSQGFKTNRDGKFKKKMTGKVERR
jgi:5-methylcytosine-specific restriction endonuclease McrA